MVKICQEVAEERKISIIPLVQALDIYRISQEVKIPLWLQHLDWHPQGQYTGWLNLEATLEAGAKGTILNHSEHKLPFGTVRRTIKRIKKTNPQFQVLICCRSLGQAEKLVKLLYCHQECTKRRIKHYFSRPKTPKDNSLVERLIQTTEYELWLFDEELIPELNYINQKLEFWTGRYNTYRPHQSLNYLTPLEYYQLSQQKKGGKVYGK